MQPRSPRIDSLPMRLARWWTRWRLPRAQRLLAAAGVWDDSLWRGEPVRICRGRWHNYHLRLDTSDYHQRGAYFYGRLLDMHAQLCILTALRPGDTFLDVGANIGALSMLAAHAVGPRGRVIAVEPNPDVYEQLLWHLSENRLTQVDANRIALSDREATMRLAVPIAGNTGAATLGALPSRHGERTDIHEVPARTGDDVFPSLPDAPLFIKLDIEGHEPAALRGLARTIRAHNPAILLECNVEMLPANGTSVRELFELLAGFAYEPFALTITWSRLTRDWRLHVHPMPTTWRPVRTQNVLFLKPDGLHAGRLASLTHPLPPRT